MNMLSTVSIDRSGGYEFDGVVVDGSLPLVHVEVVFVESSLSPFLLGRPWL